MHKLHQYAACVVVVVSVKFFLLCRRCCLIYLPCENVISGTCVTNCQLTSTDSGVEATSEVLSLEAALVEISMGLVVDVVGQVVGGVVVEEWVAEVDFVIRVGVEEEVVVVIWG